MDIEKRFHWCLFLCIWAVLLVGGRVSAGIKGSPHDIILWRKDQTAQGTAGTCAYCHIPHSAKGDRLFPDSQSIEKAKYGTLAAICAKCHEASNYVPEAVTFKQIFETLDTTKSDSKMDSHPIKGTNRNKQSNTLQNTNLDSAIGEGWPWITNGWAGGAKDTTDIECTTCHNPHNWNANAFDSGAQRKFLRAPVYDSGATIKNFCSWCHINRESGTRWNTEGTHPVASGSGIAKFSNCTTRSVYKDTSYLFQNFRDSASITDGAVNRSGRAVWDLRKQNDFLGARLYGATRDIIICQSCHMPHGVMHSADDTYDSAGSQKLNVGPLLAISNTANFADVGGYPIKAPNGSNYPVTAESTYCLGTGHKQNLLCEWCHGMTPSLSDSSEATGIFAHPVNKYPTDTQDDIPFETAEYGTVIRTKYPPTTWLKYRESKGMRVYDAGELVAGGDRKNKGRYIVCLSCHEAHQADTTNGFILKMGSGGDGATAANGAFCDGCHKDMALGNDGVDSVYFTDWTTHPSGPTAKLTNTDGGRLPNRAGLRVFGVNPDEFVSCWTCHKAHKGVEKPLLTDYQRPFSQICVNCHCEGDTVVVNVKSSSKDAQWIYGTGAGATNANPSKYYREGAWPNWWEDKTGGRTPAISSKFAVGDVMRLGSHYIGKFFGDRPKVGQASGWLGERDLLRATGSTVELDKLDHRRGTAPGITGEDKDKWLDTSSPLFVNSTWNAWTGGNGSPQKSHVGSLTETSNVIICQSCHAVHNSAKGVADDSTVSRLLLASNYDSYMCKRCHIPEVKTSSCTTSTHPMSVDASGGGFSYNTAVGKTGGLAVNITDDENAYATVYSPANYPYSKVTCDACHTVHNADSKMGAMIVEGDSTIQGSSGSGVSKIETTLNKVPIMTERNDKPTCDLCHKQGKASE